MKLKTEVIMTVEKFKKYVGVHITTNHTGKMSGMQSLSTSCLVNPICQQRIKEGNSICSHCYACTQMKMYKNMGSCFERNTKILTGRVLKKNELPLINAAYFRFEAFGDLNNTTQVINYFNICKRNPHVHFALWTKNPVLVKRAIEDGNKKPRNLQIIYSSFKVNVPEPEILDVYPFIDKIFTVYDKENAVDINCGAKSCLNCHKCYVKNDIKEIRETLK